MDWSLGSYEPNTGSDAGNMATTAKKMGIIMFSMAQKTSSPMANPAKLR